MEYNDTVSIIMPVYNEEKYIEDCIRSILEQTYYNIVEILIIDGMSVDNTRNIISKINDNRVKIIDNEKKVQSAALNIGIRAAKGDVIVRLDAHAIYDKKYVEQSVSCLNKFKQANVVNVGGPTYLLTSDNYIENCIVFLHESKFGIGVAKFRQKDYEGFVDTVWNGAFYKWMFEEVGYYNENLNRSEDNDMNNRILNKGYKIYQSKDIIAYYKPRSSIKKVLFQNYSNGRAIGDSILTNKDIVRIRHVVPAIFLITIVLFGILSGFSFISRVLEIATLGSYFLIDILETIKIGIKKGFKYIPMMFILFFVLHICYGFGTMSGFFYRILNKKEYM